MQRLKALEAQMQATTDQQISLTDPDSRSMAASGRGSGVVGYNLQVAVDREHHLIVTHDVTNVGSDCSQLARVAKQTKDTLRTERIDVVADQGYFNSLEIVRGGGHYGHTAKADDLECQDRWALRQAGFPICG